MSCFVLIIIFLVVYFVQNCPYARGKGQDKTGTHTQTQKKVRVKWKQRKDKKATKILKLIPLEMPQVVMGTTNINSLKGVPPHGLYAHWYISP